MSLRLTKINVLLFLQCVLPRPACLSSRWRPGFLDKGLNSNLSFVSLCLGGYLNSYQTNNAKGTLVELCSTYLKDFWVE